MSTEQEAVHADLVAILVALGIDDYARPYSSHDVVQREVLPAVAALTARLAAVEAESVDLRHEIARLRNPQGSVKAIAAQVNARAALAAPPAPDGAQG